MQKYEIINAIVNPGVVAIIRSEGSVGLVEAAQALYDGGARAVEISLTTPKALKAIEAIAAILPDGCVIGAGTVLEAETTRLASLAGAQFMVSPVHKDELVHAAHCYGLPVLAGAYTPTEALIAYEAGADLIKIFPANDLGPAYMRALRAPLPQLPLVPTGGVTVENCGDFFAAGCVAVGIGTSVVNASLIADQAWAEIRIRVQGYVEAAQQAQI